MLTSFFNQESNLVSNEMLSDSQNPIQIVPKDKELFVGVQSKYENLSNLRKSIENSLR